MSENLQFFNTRSRTIENFNPIKPNAVGLYHCGPTVYQNAHLGNLCPFIYWDVMRRLFEASGYQVTQVMNFTDIGHIIADADSGNDKMVNALVESGQELTIENLHAHGKEIATQYLQDLQDLNILIPHHLPYASQHIDEDIAIIEKLITNNHAYVTDNGVYFDTNSIDNYDVFNVHGDLDTDHNRIELNSEKKHPRDFALWKLSVPTGKDSSTDENSIGWDSPWGIGFPGWHIECSAMSWRYLGKSFDIHTGGIEHISVHHTNEIAQSESAFDQPMATYWIHNNHIQLNGEKISKSEGNTIYLDELDTFGLHPMDYRYLILTSHYRSEQNLTIESMRAAREARRSLLSLLEVDQESSSIAPKPEFDLEVLAQLARDLDTPGALALIRQKLKAGTVEITDKIRLQNTITHILGITLDDLKDEEEVPLDPNLLSLLKRRQAAKDNSNYDLADSIRSEIKARGYEVRDGEDGQKLYRP